jgi:flagellar protein FlaG
MSNDITSSRLPPAAVPSTPAAKPAEVDRAQAAKAAQDAQAIKVAHAIKAAEIAKPDVETQPKQDPQESRRTLEEATEQLNQQMRRNSRDLNFSLDDVSKKLVVTVKNLDGEVIRQIPSEVALRVAHNVDNMKGLMQDEKT